MPSSLFLKCSKRLISYLSNSLSYVRVGAFAVAHVGLRQVIFILAEMVSPSHGIGYWIVVVLGNLFIVGFEGLIVGIQTMRLEYYEFFSKFFKGGGATLRADQPAPVWRRLTGILDAPGSLKGHRNQS